MGNSFTLHFVTDDERYSDTSDTYFSITAIEAFSSREELNETVRFSTMELEDGTLAITQCHGVALDVVVPAKIDGVDVTEIYGFHEFDRNVKNVIIQEGIESISDWAFVECYELESIDLPDSLTEIGEFCFGACFSLENVILPKNLKSIDNFAFVGCGIKELVIPASVTELPESDESGSSAFCDCKNLKSVIFEGGNTPVASNMFQGCTKLSNVTLAEGLEDIDNHAFQDCVSLKHIELPSTLKDIWSDAFSGSGLTSIVLPEGMERISGGAFYNCADLKSIYIPEGVSFLDYGSPVFDGCHPDFTIYGVAGSPAEAYAEEYEIPFVAGNIPA